MRRLQASLGFVMAAVLGGALLAGSPTLTSASDDAAAPKFSTFASADDLAAEVKFLVADLEKAVVDEDEYEEPGRGPIHPRRQHDHADRHRLGPARPG